jgi:hypothetical protein
MQTLHIVIEHRNDDGELTEYEKLEVDDTYTALAIASELSSLPNVSPELQAAARAFRDHRIETLPPYVRLNRTGFADLTRAQLARIIPRQRGANTVPLKKARST